MLVWRVLLLNSSPVAWRMAEASGLWGWSWSCSWTEGGLDFFRFSPLLFPFLGHPEHSFNAGFLVVLSPQRLAKRLLGQIVDRCRNGLGFHNDIDGNNTVQELLIPASKVGLVIGKGGETIKQLQVRGPLPSPSQCGASPQRSGCPG